MKTPISILSLILGLFCWQSSTATLLPDNMLPCHEQDDVTFKTSVTGPGYSYLWDFGPLGTFSNNNPVFTAPLSSLAYQDAPFTASLTIFLPGGGSLQEQATVYPVLCTPQQDEQSNWYFHTGAGLDFSTPAPLPVPTTEAFNAGAMLPGGQQGRCAVTQSDHTGQLHVYSDGESVWTPGPNGHVLANPQNPLWGELPKSRGALILPSLKQSVNFPADYVIFTIDRIFPNNVGNSVGLHFTELVINNPDPADGPVAGPGVFVNTPIQNLNDPAYAASSLDQAFLCGGSLVAVPDCDDTYDESFWILTTIRRSDAPRYDLAVFRYSTGTGYQFSFHSTFQGPVQHPYAQLEVSPDGKKLAVGGLTAGESGLYLYDFDPVTGLISNPQALNKRRIYGLCFSPDSKRLYATDRSNSNELLQYDLTATNINNSERILAMGGPGGNGKFFDLEMGPDKHIYVAREGKDSLGVILYPNQLSTPADPNGPGFMQNGPALNPPGFSGIVADRSLPNMLNANPDCGDSNDLVGPAGRKANSNAVKSGHGSPVKEDLSSAIKLQVSPNPATDHLQLQFQLPRKTRIELYVTDLAGQRIWESPGKTCDAGKHKLEIRFPESLPQGLFFLNLKTETQSINRKIIRLR